MKSRINYEKVDEAGASFDVMLRQLEEQSKRLQSQSPCNSCSQKERRRAAKRAKVKLAGASPPQLRALSEGSG